MTDFFEDTLEDISASLSEGLKKTQDDILDEIRSMVGNDEIEISRVRGIYDRIFKHGTASLIRLEDDEFKVIDDAENEISNKEASLSHALKKSEMGLYFLEQGDLIGAIDFFADATMYLGMALGYKLLGKEHRAVFDAQEKMLVFQADKIDKYQKGPKKKSLDSQQKWALANEYFKKEISLHGTLKAARFAAAKKAGIVVEERQLTKMMPTPR